jgi:hypothetical protein
MWCPHRVHGALNEDGHRGRWVLAGGRCAPGIHAKGQYRWEPPRLAYATKR